MIQRPIKILEFYNTGLLFLTNTGEKRSIELEKVILEQYRTRVLDKDQFTKAKIEEFGQIFWENQAFMKDLKGNEILCEYDISPEFLMTHSVRVLS